MYENDLREPPLTLVLAYAKLANLSTDVLIDDKWSVADVKEVGRQSDRQTTKNQGCAP